MGKYIGIDLGTTYSGIAYVDEKGSAQMIHNAEGENITPSAVLFEDGIAIVGTDAKKSSIMYPDHFVAFAKRNMGSKINNYRIDGNTYSPEDISALVLKKLCKDARAALGDEILGAVITVPAYFTDAQRQSTMDAAKMIGLPVLAIINEPTAAALAYGIQKGDEESGKVLVYDMGGGTFDVSIMQFSKDKIETLTSMGNSQLGGYDFDLSIVDWAKSQAKQQGVDIDLDICASQNLLIEAEQAKKALSTGKQTAKINLMVCGKAIRLDLTKEVFERMIDPLVFESISLMNCAMEEANLDYSALDKILLVGGSTRIPYVQKMIREETGLNPSVDTNPDEVVAKGAAFHAISCARERAERKKETPDNGLYASSEERNVPIIDMKSIPQANNTYSFTDRTSHGVGVEIWNSNRGEMENSVILPKNSVVPAEGACDYQTLEDYQKSFVLTVRQGETTELKYTTVIGETEIKLRPKPKGYPIRIVISCDADSIIHVHAIDLEDNKDLGEMKIDRVSNLTDEEINKSKEKIGKLNIGWE